MVFVVFSQAHGSLILQIGLEKKEKTTKRLYKVFIHKVIITKCESCHSFEDYASSRNLKIMHQAEMKASFLPNTEILNISKDVSCAQNTIHSGGEPYKLYEVWL